LNKIDNWRCEAQDELYDEALTTALTTCWNKLKKYYKLADETPVYYAAIVLNPTLKMNWFNNQ